MNLTGELRWHLGEADFALLHYSEDMAAFSIDSVMVPSAFRGRGIGTELIRRVLIMADAVGKDVFLSARPIGNSGEDRLLRLVHYYERFGFIQIDRGLTVVYMARRQTAKGCKHER